jgi:hypothetical protein
VRKTRKYAEAGGQALIEAVRDLMVSEGRGTSLREIAAELNCSGIYTVRGGRLVPSAVRTVLRVRGAP